MSRYQPPFIEFMLENIVAVLKEGVGQTTVLSE